MLPGPAECGEVFVKVRRGAKIVSMPARHNKIGVLCFLGPPKKCDAMTPDPAMSL